MCWRSHLQGPGVIVAVDYPSAALNWVAETYLQRSMNELQFTVPFCPPVIVLLPAMTGFAELNQALI